MTTDTHLYRPATALDLLRWPLIGRLLRWRWGRLVFQLPLLALAALLIYDGLTGPQSAAENLATLVPWVHYRGFVILALLLVGNLFCMGCPFMLPRTLAKRLSVRGRRFPKRLRNKWIAIGALFALFFLYEWLDMWASPALTAWVIVAYFVASFVMEAIFTESAFCKYICPLGTFNFVYSTVSPTQISVRDPEVCRTCVGKECVTGSYRETPIVLVDQIGSDGAPVKTHTNSPQGTPGCGTLLFPPHMRTNLDCTLCLDCARACPHNNVALFARAPGAELARPGAWPARWDTSLLVIGLAFMGLVNAFGMVPPVYDLMQVLARSLGLTALGLSDQAIEGITLLLIFGVGALLLPALLALAAAWVSRRLTGTLRRDSARHTVAAFAPAFVPLGFGLWAAHYGFHFLIGAFAIVPVFQSFLIDHNIALFGAPNWALTGIEDLVVIGFIQTLALLAGFGGSLYLAQRTALRLYRRDAMAGLLPWALLFLLMMLAGLWLFSQPMEMRGTVLFD
ncbi:MAG: FesM [Aggregatilineales bacterium]